MKTTKEQKINAEEYRKDPLFSRNQEIWKYRFERKWTLKKIADRFHITIDEVKAGITKHKRYFEQEYN